MLLVAHQTAAVHTRASWVIVAQDNNTGLLGPRAVAHKKTIALQNCSAQPMRPNCESEFKI
jgi:hypothetical protein